MLGPISPPPGLAVKGRISLHLTQACRVQGKGGSEQAWGEWQARVLSKGPGWEAAAEVSNGGEG